MESAQAYLAVSGRSYPDPEVNVEGVGAQIKVWGSKTSVRMNI